MATTSNEPSQYVVAHVRELLAKDPRVNELELQVTVAGRKVFITGTVPTKERRDGITAVASELLPDHEIYNHTSVGVPTDEPEVENIS